MDTEQIRALAIKRHDADADYFQGVYSGKLQSSQTEVFLYGRNMILDELEKIVACLPANARILDVGSGTGHLTKWLSDKGFDVYGIEPSADMYKYATVNFPGIEFKKGISADLPYNNDFFDLVIAIEVLRYLDEKDNILTYREFNRVLKKGGACFVTHVNLYSSDCYYFFYQLQYHIRRLGSKTYHFCNFTTSTKQEKLLKQSGFERVVAVGRMIGSIRIFYKLSIHIGRIAGTIAKKISSQRFGYTPLIHFAGHLIMIAHKNDDK